jgi:C-methyltransferase.
VDDMRGVTDAIRELLTDDGILVLEVGYFLDMLREGHFDNNYLEHVSHWTLAPMQKFFARHGLCLYDAEHVDSQGGSIRCYVSKRTRKTTDRLDGMLGRERYLVTPEALERFRARIATTKTELTETLKAIKAQGKTIAAFGCPAKATTLLHEFGIGRETLEYMVEEAPTKIGKFSPGKHVPVVSVEHFREHPPDYCLILAWNFAANIRNRFDWFVEGGGQWILPMPEVKVCE